MSDIVNPTSELMLEWINHFVYQWWFGLPMKRTSVSININLLPRDPFFDSVVGRVLRWALSVGRYLVVFTELVVIVSFATRFTLDRQRTDLNESLNQKQMIIKSYGDLENKFRTIQTKIGDFEQVEQQGNIVDVFPKLAAVMPSDIRLTELTISNDQVLLSGSALSQRSLNTFLNNLQVSKTFFGITVDKIESQGERSTGFEFTLRANTKENAGANVQKAAPAPKPAAVEKEDI